MHELSLAGGVLNLVEEALREQPRVRLRRMTLDVGALSGVDIPALRFALESIREGTLLQEAEIEICDQPGTAWCLDCARAVQIRSRLDDCPDCQGRHLQPIGGTELRLRELLVDDLPAATST